MKIYFEKVLKPRKNLGEANPAVVAAGVKDLEKTLSVMEQRLQSSKYLVAGDEPSFADLDIIP